MADLADQLALLRRKIARIDLKYTAPSPPRVTAPPLPKLPDFSSRIENAISGQIIETEHGRHFEAERLFERHRRYGSVDISDLNELAPDLLHSLSGGSIPSAHPQKWAFLDTETTGLAGGSGTYAFLVGIGSIDASGFRVRQFFMRDYAEERSQLAAVAAYLAGFDVLITYNGKTYDQPLLETRYTLARQRHPFARMEHLDLLFGARRLWKLRLANCKLTHLEFQILGVERHGDLAGEVIPHYYFEYVRSQCALTLVPIFHHNQMDILTLACLSALVPQCFRDPSRVAARHGADLLGLARWLLAEGRDADAIALMHRAIEIGLPDALLFTTLFEIGVLEKKRKNEAAALAIFTDLVASPNPCRARAYEQLAKFYEHRERNYVMALEMTIAALALDASDALRNRRSRLDRKLARAPRSLMR